MVKNPKDIKILLQKELPGAKSLQKMLPYKRTLQAPANQQDKIKRSSVLLLLFIENDRLKCFLTKRQKTMSFHAGQIAFPGGKTEVGETSEDTALRETYEEIGIEPDNIEILGRLTSFYVEVSHFQIVPVVGWIDKKPRLMVNPDEVEKTIVFPVEDAMGFLGTSEVVINSKKKNVPCFKYDNEIIWGATSMVISEFYDLIKQNNL